MVVRRKLTAAVAALAFLAAGATALPTTARAGENAAAGTIFGGVVGGLIGSSLGHGPGRGIATVGGAVLGAVIGNSVGQSADDAAYGPQEGGYYAAYGPRPYYPPPRVYYAPAPIYAAPYPQPYVVDAEPDCRRYQTMIVIEGQPEPAYGTACRQPDGSWQPVQ